ncbi:TrmH family RNA methyltransferase [Ligilactobacillus araffinosus]|uniref:23S rRNA methyltransferase n=1 Tax=Ligilactobacillus araffinosus DSM 20653 TaxID=1423820 RepID=A0A0R1ZLU6_9LACO|nr:RNA methyltransferase [Ligilactobacillus araffinosus]KRM51939.1 23S rRNA methyltransferase [Ligilactobacillus araffinosus DSM 20653]
MKIITSVNNSQVKAWSKLNTKKGRLKQGKYLLDGWHLVKEAIRTREPIETIMVQPDFKHLQEIEVPEGAGLIQITDNVVKHLSDTKHPQGVMAVVKIPEQQTIEPEDVNGAWLFMDNVQDPGNIGTMVRTADAAGFSGIVFGDGTADVYNPKIVRSMQGSQFHLKMVTAPLEPWIQAFKAQNKPVFGTELNPDARPYDQVGKHADFALIMGNEGNGMNKELLKQTSLNLYIPIIGKAESLNVAVAAGILMFQLKAN